MSNSHNPAAAGEFVISRTFDAPRQRVWQAWTERDQLMQWFGPKGFTMEVATLDLRPGGTFLYGLRSPDGMRMWGKFMYREIVAPERIVLTNCFSDEQGGITRHPFHPNWPRELLSTTTLWEQDGKTTVTIRWSPLDPTPEERQTFDSNHESMRLGWGGTLDRLEAYLKNNHA